MKYEIEGVEAAVKKLERFTGSVQRKVVRKGVNAGGAIQLKRARALAPKGKTGFFRRSLTKVTRSYAKRGVFVSLVGQQKKKTFSDKAIATANKRKGGSGGGISGQGKVVPIHLIENPTKPHVQRQSAAMRRRGRRRAARKVMVFRSGGGTIFASKINHPGTKGAGFLKQAESSSRAAVSAAMASKISAEADAEAAKL